MSSKFNALQTRLKNIILKCDLKLMDFKYDTNLIYEEGLTHSICPVHYILILFLCQLKYPINKTKYLYIFKILKIIKIVYFKAGSQVNERGRS